MTSTKIVSIFVRLIIPVILSLVYFFYWDTQHNIEGLWIYSGWMTLLFWRFFSARLSQGRESMEKRIQALEEIILGKVDQGSTGGDLREENLLEGLKDRVSQLEAKIT